jgi:hypothetical protein
MTSDKNERTQKNPDTVTEQYGPVKNAIPSIVMKSGCLFFLFVLSERFP